MVYVTQHGRPVVVLVDYDRYETLIAQLEDLSDLASFQASEAEPTRPYEEFLAELGSSRQDTSPASSESVNEGNET